MRMLHPPYYTLTYTTTYVPEKEAVGNPRENEQKKEDED